MRSLIRQSKVCRDTDADPREQEQDRRASQYVGELKRRCGDSRWNLVEIDFDKRRRKPDPGDNQQD